MASRVEADEADMAGEVEEGRAGARRNIGMVEAAGSHNPRRRHRRGSPWRAAPASAAAGDSALFEDVMKAEWCLGCRIEPI